MHILYLHQYFCPPGGSGNDRSRMLALEWVRQGHQVTMITSPAYFPPEQKQDLLSGRTKWMDSEGIRIGIVPVDYDHMMGFGTRIWAWLSFYLKALRLAGSLREADLIYASSSPLTVGELGRKLSRKLNVPFVFETVDVWPDVPIGMRFIRNRLLITWLNERTNRIYKEARKIVCLSEGMAEQVLSHGTDPQKVIVSHNGTDTKQFPYLQRKEKDSFTVLYAGTVGLANGLDQLIALAKHMEAKVPEVRFVVLGEGNDLARVKKIARELGLSNVEFLPRIPKEQVNEVMQQADIGFVCFAPHKVLEANSANKFFDYLASGLPVVLNYEGWQAEYLREWNAGFSSPQGDMDALAANLLLLIKDRALREKMGRNGRKLALERFDRKELAGTLLQMFSELKRDT